MQTNIEGYHSITEQSTPLRVKMHSHEVYEIYCFLEGDAQYCVEGRWYALHPGDVLLLTKGEVHRVDLLSEAKYCRIGVHFDLTDVPTPLDMQRLLSPFHDRPLGKFNHYPARLFQNERWIHYLEQIAHADDESTAVCFLLPLLSELADAFPILQNADLFAKKDTAAPIMKYINHHLTDALTLQNLAQRFYLSQTHLNRLFRQSTGTTVWEYITIKRLFLAKKLLEQGYAPTTVCEPCGFQEYSTFYRAYKRHFGVSPSTHAVKRKS